MFKIKKAVSFCTATAMFAAATFFGIAPENITPAAAETSQGNSASTGEGALNDYFYKQLSPSAKVFYDAMKEMHENGMLMSGNKNLELTAGDKPYISQEDAELYLAGPDNTAILSDFGAARDAFCADYPDIFYVDFSALSVRATTKEVKGKTVYNIYLGTGRYTTYYTPGFTDEAQVKKAVKEFDETVDKIVSEAGKVTAGTGQDLTAKKVEFVHDYITNNTSYRLEDACKEENVNLIRTAYGSLVKKEAVCEGYSRALKSVLDKLDIPCVLVQGVYKHTADVVELHMWNNVQINGKWYGVDATMDDPINKKSASTDGKDGYESHEYLLVSDSKMNQHHSPSSVMSEANFPFEYPMLDVEEFGVEVTEYDNGLVVKYKADGKMEDEDLQAGEYHISFKGMGYKKAAENGYYIMCRFYQPDEDTGILDYTDWYYICPELYDNRRDLVDSDTELFMRLPQVEYIEYGVTERAPVTMTVSGYTIPDSTYYGDPFQLTATTGMLYNPSGTYKAPPYPKVCDPKLNGWLDVTRKYHIEIEFDDTLVADNSGKDFDITVSSWKRTPDGKYHDNTPAASRAVFENKKFDGKNTISFDFQASTMWADDNSFYEFQVVGLVGKSSNKSPMEVVYGASNRMAVCAYRSSGYFWNVFAQPTLIENADLSTEGWKTDDGSEVSELLKHRMALVVSRAGNDQTDTMNKLIKETGDEVLSSETYNINLTVCKKQVIETGQGVRVCMGFPEGYGPEDAGVTFKVYHFIKDDTGNTVGVEELPCTVTRYGLLVLCKSFSPFAVAAVKSDENTPAEKSVVLSETAGGKVTADGKDSIFTIEKDETVTLTITADEGYVVDALSIGCEYTVIDGRPGDTSMKIELNEKDLAERANIIDVMFAAAQVKAQEIANGENVVVIEVKENSGEQEEPPADQGDDKEEPPADQGDDKEEPPADEGDDKEEPPADQGDDKEEPPADSEKDDPAADNGDKDSVPGDSDNSPDTGKTQGEFSRIMLLAGGTALLFYSVSGKRGRKEKR